MRIRLNLASRPYADLSPRLKLLRIAMAAMALLCVLLALAVYAFHQRAVEARAREHSLDGRIAAIQRERQGYQELMSQPENALLLKQASTLNSLFDEKGFSWTLAMEDLETVLPGGVQVTTLEPQREKDGHITLRLRVIGPRDKVVDLVANLEHSRRFLLPRIVSEGAEAAQGANAQQLEPVSASNRFNFDLLAEYNPTAPGERRQEKKTAETGVAAARPQARPQTAPRPAPAQPRPAVPAAPRPQQTVQRPPAAPRTAVPNPAPVPPAPQPGTRPRRLMTVRPRPARPSDIPEPRPMPMPVPDNNDQGGPQ